MIINVSRTTEVSSRERFDYWRDAVSSSIVPVDAVANPRAGFNGQLRYAHAGATHLVDILADPHRVHRTKRLVDRSQSGCYKVSAQLLGRAVLSQGSRTALLEPGDFAIYDPDRPYTLTFDTAHHQLVALVPKGLLRLSPHDLDPLLASRISGRQSMGTLVFAYFAELALQFDGLGGVDGVRLGDNVAELLNSLLLGQLPCSQLAVDRRNLFSRVTAYIEQHLGEPDLCPEQIAAAHGYSTRALHQLFHDTGTTVSSWVRERRLEQCRRELRDPASRTVPIGIIGARWGFADAAHFSRVFKAAFGVGPRAFRCGCDTERTEVASGA
ncbi:MAG: helix-turn-helix domain-containing protein [Acidimicrobiales bacterium]